MKRNIIGTTLCMLLACTAFGQMYFNRQYCGRNNFGRGGGFHSNSYGWNNGWGQTNTNDVAIAGIHGLTQIITAGIIAEAVTKTERQKQPSVVVIQQPAAKLQYGYYYGTDGRLYYGYFYGY